MVLKRVVYGVDKNPMAVELAKVALWLHSFTISAPLSFLDHHLRCGDSVLGAWVRPTVDALRARGALFNTGAIARVEQVAGLMAEIEETTDNDIAEVTESKAKFGVVEEVTEPVAAFFSPLTAERLMGVFDVAPKKAPLAVDDRRRVLADRLVNEARSRAARHRFFHWEIGFPNVWSNLLSVTPRGGFDAVIGNPPYVRQELLGDEVERALKVGYTAYDGLADLYIFFYE